MEEPDGLYSSSISKMEAQNTQWFARERIEWQRIDPASRQADILMNAGFVEGEHDDGLHPEGPAGRYSPDEPKYNQYLREQGFSGRNPWLEWANSAEDDQGVLRSGFYMQNAHRAAGVPAEHSETAYLTHRIIETIDELCDEPWCVHASYIKPHWPYLEPEPYHSLYRDVPLADAVRSDQELTDPHPIYQAYTELAVARTFIDDAKRRHILPTYYELVKATPGLVSGTTQSPGRQPGNGKRVEWVVTPAGDSDRVLGRRGRARGAEDSGVCGGSLMTDVPAGMDEHGSFSSFKPLRLTELPEADLAPVQVFGGRTT